MVRPYRSFLVRTSIVLSAFSLASFLMLSSSGVSATTTSATASVIVPSACTMSSTLNSSHTATIANGTSQSNIGKTTFKVVCNDGSGFAIYAVGYSNDEYGNNKLLATIGGVLTPASDIVTGTATSGSTSNWAMKLTAVSDTYAPTIHDSYDSSSYHTVPNTYTKVASFSAATDTTTGSSLEATYQAYISPTAPAGSYDGTVRYTMVHPATELPNMPRTCSSNKICYWPNGDGEVADSMGDQSKNYGTTTGNIVANMTIQLWASNFQRDGYGFAGWSDKFDWVLNENDENGNGTGKNEGYHIYGPNATITTPSDMSNGISLYAVWIPSQGYMQDFTPMQCTAMDTGEVTALKDKRDNQVYAVAKLADNKCWMIENLRLDNQYTVGNNINDSSVTNESLTQGYHKWDGTGTDYGDFVGLATPEAGDFISSTIANSLYSTIIDGNKEVIGTSDYPAYRFPRYNNQNTASPVSSMTIWDNNSNIYSLGNYYTWSAAIADTSYYNTNNQSVTTTSICPVNWHLPTGGNKYNASNSEFWQLIVNEIVGTEPANMSSSTVPSYSSNPPESSNAPVLLKSYPNNFIYSGCFGNSSPNSRKDNGYYLSSTAKSYDSSYLFGLSPYSVSPGTGWNGKSLGYSVRCVAGS